MTDLTERMARLTRAQRAVFDRRLRQLGEPAAADPPIARRASGHTHGLTVDQERIWLIHQFDPNDPAYNVFFASRLKGELSYGALDRAVNDFVARHEPLRTTFETRNGRPVAVVHDEAPLEVQVTDLRGLPAGEREAALQRQAIEEVRRPFDLTAAPLLRVRVLRLADDEHMLVGTVDHLIWDRASLGVFNAEFAELYNAHAVGRVPQLPPVELHFGDYAEWQPGWLSRDVTTVHVPYWQERLAGAAPALELPTDRPRPAIQRFNGARYQFRLTPALTEAVRELARVENVTVNVALLAAWQLLLHRLSGQSDIVVGTTSSTRGRPETESMIGYFLTMLPLRVQVRAELTFRDLTAAARAAVLGGFDHHDVPFGVLLDALDVRRDPSRNPVYQTTFIFVDFVHEKQEPLHGLRSTTIMLDNFTAKDDVTLGFFDDRSLGADHYFGLLEYNTDLFDEETIVRMSEQLMQVLEQAVADPSRRVGDFALMSPEQVRQVVVEWNATAAASDPAATVDGLVRAQATRTPDAVAVRGQDEQLTYRQLVDRADVIAQELRRRGVGPEVVVGVAVDRSADLVAALLGVLAAGGAYLPLDRSHPPHRLAGIIEPSGARLVVTAGPAAELFATLAPGVLVLDELPPRLVGDESLAGLGDAAGGARLAYVMYTSGTTGTPKGVEITHGNLINVLLDLDARLAIGPGDVLAAVTPVTFDIAGFELFGPLLVGATTLVVPRAESQQGGPLAEALAAGGATVMQATPTTWRLLLDAGWRNPAALRMLVGGEALPPGLAGELGSLPGRAWNVYGPTETTIWSTIWPIAADGRPVSIGRPLANTRVYVLDGDRRPVPVGVAGDLYIGGAGVARGYRAAPALTAERFVPDPLAADRDAIMYRTGDRAQWQRDGELIFLGRDDHQVKLRGHRIELGEIETRLEEHPKVRRSVVVVREDRVGDARLVGYVEPAGNGPPTAAELTARLRTVLPEYLVPAAVVVLDRLPMTANDKIDRAALPPPPLDRGSDRGEAPRNPLELRIAQIWEDVLDVRPVGIRDRFFDLGGHSLLVLRLMADLEAEFGVALPMGAIFQGATVERFAHMLRDGFQPETEVHAVQLRPGPDRPLFFVHPAGSEVVCYMPFAELIEPATRSLYALASPHPVDGRFPQADFEGRAAAFARLIRDTQPVGPYELVGWCYGGINAYAIAVELERAGEQVSVVLIDSHPPTTVEVEPARADIVLAIAANLQWDYLPETVTRDDLHRMTDDEQVDYLLGIARAGNYLPAESGQAQMASVIDMWVANLRMLWRYQPPLLAAPLTFVRAEAEDDEPFQAWRSLAAGRFRELVAPGNHYTVVRRPLVGEVARIVSSSPDWAMEDES